MNLNLEWMESDGRGGFACGTISGEIRRKWHGLLWRAQKPPRDRERLLVGLQEFFENQQTRERVWLSARWEDGRWLQPDIEPTFSPAPFPQWTWTLPNGGKLEKTVWMTSHSPAFVGIRYVYTGPAVDDFLVTRPILPSTPPRLHLSTPVIREVLVQLDRLQDDLKRGIIPEEVTILSEETGDTTRPSELDEDTRQELANEIDEYAHSDIDDKVYARKLVRQVALEIEKDCEDVHTEDEALGQHIRIRLVDGMPIDLAYSHERLATGTDLVALYHAEAERRAGLVVMGLPDEYDYLEKMLALGADRFLVATGEGRRTLLAGYPWFTDWGRDAMISLPGLCLATSRVGEAREIIRHFLEFLDEGIIPNLFPEAGEIPMYNTVDATLWLVEMAFRAWSPGEIVADEFLWSALQEIIQSHEAGTRNNVREDEDHLLRAGSPGTQLTWMDVKVNGHVPTPRHGKAVEIQGLWYNAKLLVAAACSAAGQEPRAAELRASAGRTRESFHQRFFSGALPWPADVVDRDAAGDADFSLRPNVVIPFALHHPIYDAERRASILRSVADHLLTPRGLRTLAPSDRAYKGIYRGNVVTRDHAYHQGTTWMWILWPWVKGVERERRDVPELYQRLPMLRAGLVEHLVAEGCVGHANEIFDGDFPHNPRGCYAQAWSLSAIIEILRSARGS